MSSHCRDMSYDSVWGRASPIPTEDPLPLSSKSAEITADSPAPIKPDSRKRRCRLGDDEWYLEIASMLLGTAFLMCLVYMFFRIDGHPTTYWKVPMTTGATVAIATYCIEALTLYSLSACVGQLKWIAFKRRATSVAELQQFDEASRGGVKGSLKMIIGRGGPFAAFGVFVMVLTGAIAPFTLQVLKTPIRIVSTGQVASVHRALSYTEWTGGDTLAPLPSPIMKAAINDGLYGYVANSSQKAPYYMCPTGNCTFDPFYNLGVCSLCTDVSSQLHVTGFCSVNNPVYMWPNCTYSLPSSLNGLSVSPNLTGTGMISITNYNWGMNSGGLGPVPENIIEFVAINVPDHNITGTEPNPPGSASHCKLIFCVQSVSTQVVNGFFSQNVSQAFPDVNFTKVNATENYATYEFSVPGNDTFSVSSPTWFSLQNELSDLFTGVSSISAEDAYKMNIDVNPIQAILASGNVSGVADSIATSMSTRMREASPVWPNLNPLSIEVVVGTSHATESYFYVDWVWMLAALIAVVLAWLFVCSTIEMTVYHRAPSWKNSIFPIAYHGLCDDAKASYTAADGETIHAMEKHAKKTAVQLRASGGPSLLAHDIDQSEFLKSKKRFSSLSKLAPSYDFGADDDYEVV